MPELSYHSFVVSFVTIAKHQCMSSCEFILILFDCQHITISFSQESHWVFSFYPNLYNYPGLEIPNWMSLDNTVHNDLTSPYVHYGAHFLLWLGGNLDHPKIPIVSSGIKPQECVYVRERGQSPCWECAEEQLSLSS